jgi:DUF4097 and DUF4098 domain-containing protein YvlB
MRMMFSGMPSHVLMRRAAIALIVFGVFGIASTSRGMAQRSYTKVYPARERVKLEVKNWSGTIKVQGCDCSEIRVTTTLESKGVRVNPAMNDGTFLIDVMRDNPGNENPGFVTFTIKIPSTSTLDLETRMGNIEVSNVVGESVRAFIALEGDINLLNMRTGSVLAHNGSGTILFDGELQRGGTYSFRSTDGDINIRIPSYSAFHLEATAPSSRNITLGAFASASLNSLGGGRKLVGIFGDGQATVSVMNFRGRIAFLER